jgi:hypothetical protein
MNGAGFFCHLTSPGNFATLITVTERYEMMILTIEAALTMGLSMRHCLEPKDKV